MRSKWRLADFNSSGTGNFFSFHDSQFCFFCGFCFFCKILFNYYFLMFFLPLSSLTTSRRLFRFRPHDWKLLITRLFTIPDKLITMIIVHPWPSKYYLIVVKTSNQKALLTDLVGTNSKAEKFGGVNIISSLWLLVKSRPYYWTNENQPKIKFQREICEFLNLI